MITAVFVLIVFAFFLLWYFLSDEDSIIPKEYVGVATLIFLFIGSLMMWLELR